MHCPPLADFRLLIKYRLFHSLSPMQNNLYFAHWRNEAAAWRTSAFSGARCLQETRNVLQEVLVFSGGQRTDTPAHLPAQPPAHEQAQPPRSPPLLPGSVRERVERLGSDPWPAPSQAQLGRHTIQHNRAASGCQTCAACLLLRYAQVCLLVSRGKLVSLQSCRASGLTSVRATAFVRHLRHAAAHRCAETAAFGNPSAFVNVLQLTSAFVQRIQPWCSRGSAVRSL